MATAGAPASAGSKAPGFHKEDALPLSLPLPTDLTLTSEVVALGRLLSTTERRTSPPIDNGSDSTTRDVHLVTQSRHA